MKSEDIKSLNLEESFTGVDDILSKLSRDDLPLEESFSLYKEGMELISHCSDIIDGVEKQIIVLQQGEDSEDDEI